MAECHNIIAYVDGSWNSAAQMGSYAIVLVSEDGHIHKSAEVLSANVESSTDCETKGILSVPEFVYAKFGPGCTVTIKSDSKSSIESVTGKVSRRGFRRVSEHDLFQSRVLRCGLQVALEYVPAHDATASSYFHTQADHAAGRVLTDAVRTRRAA